MQNKNNMEFENKDQALIHQTQDQWILIHFFVFFFQSAQNFDQILQLLC